MGMASIYQVPMVGSDVCGYAENTTETLCARWAMLGAFSPFYRVHSTVGTIPHELYRWPLTTAAGIKAINTRYRLLDYLYTAFHQQTLDGTPAIQPIWYQYPQDSKTFPIDTQYFFGPNVLVSPVLEENATAVDIYLPNDIFYDFWTLAPVRGRGAYVHLDDVDFTDIPLHIRGGVVLPLRTEGANTTTMLRQKPFTLVVAPGLDGSASGELYLDDGDSLVQSRTTQLSFEWQRNRLTISGSAQYPASLDSVTILGYGRQSPKAVTVGGAKTKFGWSATGANGAVTVKVGKPLVSGTVVEVQF